MGVSAVSEVYEIASGGRIAGFGALRLLKFEAVKVAVFFGFIVVDNDNAGLLAAGCESLLGRALSRPVAQGRARDQGDRCRGRRRPARVRGFPRSHPGAGSQGGPGRPRGRRVRGGGDPTGRRICD